MTTRNDPITCPHNPDRKLPLAAGAFTSLCIAIHEFNTQWWLDPATGKPKERNIGEMLMLMVSELSEAMEGHRKNLMDDKLPAFPMIEVELIDAVIREMDLLGYFYKIRKEKMEAAHGNPEHAFTPGDILYDKCHYNASRIDHKPAHRLSEHGKKY